MIDGQDPIPQMDGADPNMYQEGFTRSSVNMLMGEVGAIEGKPAEEYFSVLKAAVTSQGYFDMATAIDRVSNTSEGTLLRGSYEPVATSWRDGKPTKTMSAEQWAREYLAQGLGNALLDLQDLSHEDSSGQSSRHGTSTIADLRGDTDLHKELFVAFARIFAREPERLDATVPTPDQVTDIEQMNLTEEDREKGVVTLEGQPDKIVRFQKVTVDSNVPGFDFEMWRHNRSGYIRGNGTDSHKIYLERKKAEPVSQAA